MKALYKHLILVSLFSITMAVIESAVVVYLRELYYATGFSVAFKEIPPRIIFVELSRELATLGMLISVGWLTGKNARTRFSWFLYAFAIWDIFYYIMLKIFIDWPKSLFEWDILFLIPVTWLAPVLAPIICSFTMIALSLIILKCNEKNPDFRLRRLPLSIIVIGAIFIYISFTQDYTFIIIKNGFYKDFSNLLKNPEFIKISSTYIPESFNWVLFSVGELLILAGAMKIVVSEKVLVKTTIHDHKAIRTRP